MTRRTRAGGLSTRRQVASSTVTQVPSEPTSARATLKAAFGQQVVEVVSGNAARNVGKLAADLLAIAVGEGFEASVNFGAASAFADDAVEIFGAGRAHVQALAAVGENFERLDVVVRLAGHDRVHAAGVVADHASEGAAVVGSGIGREGEVMLFGCGAKASRTTPGSTRAMRRAASISRMDAMYFEKSRMTAALQHCPASEVPPPRASNGAS